MSTTPLMVITKQALVSARSELRKAKAEQIAINRRVARLQQLVDGLTTILDKPFNAQSSGLLETTRLALKLTGHHMTAAEVTRQIDAMGYEWKNPDHAVIAVHTVLLRLKEKGEVVRLKLKTADGKERIVYRWRFEEPEILEEPF